jgi:Fe-Mn family superoxide dismutase
MQHKLPELPYAIDALEPHLSAETLEFHYGKHHKKYVDTLNDLVRGTEFADRSLEEIVIAAPSGPLRNNAGQTWNHNLYWQELSSKGGGEPRGELAVGIDRSFGSFSAFRSQFNTAAKELFGSGWVWLSRAKENGKLLIESTKDAENPLMQGRTPLLTCDVWEHAYYIDYRNDRAPYLEAFWHLIDWGFASSRLGAKDAGP